MYKRNFLNSGDYVVLVPLGAMLTLSYNLDGILDSVKVDGEPLIDGSKEFMQSVKKNKTFPLNLHIKNGRTEVRGVLYTSNIKTCLGDLPKNLSKVYIKDYIENGQKYNFFATTFDTDSSSYSGYNVTAMNEWLKMAGFNTIKGFLLPNGNDNIENTIKKYLVEDTNFIPGLISYYLVFNSGDDYNYISAGMHGYEVGYKNSTTSNGDVIPEVRFTEDGQFVADVELKDNSESIVKRLGYGTVVKFNLHKSSYVILNDEGDIVYSISANKVIYNDSIVCPFCKKQVNLNSDRIMCSNTRCVSRMYPNISHTLKKLHLDTLSYEDYVSAFKDYSKLLVSDILDLPQYKYAEINITIADLFDAIIPVNEVRNRSVFRIFVNKCANSIETVRYYIANPGEMLSDFRDVQTNSSGNEFVDWLRDSTNVTVFNRFINHPSLHIILKNKEYDALPILRGQNICITGRFKHGDAGKIHDILASYSANVSNKLDNKTSVVVVGDSNEDVSGVIIHNARDRRIPVIAESEFFSRYDIDKDISNNLQ